MTNIRKIMAWANDLKKVEEIVEAIERR